MKHSKKTKQTKNNAKITLRDFVPPVFFKLPNLTTECVLGLIIVSAFLAGIITSLFFPIQMMKLGYLLGIHSYDKYLSTSSQLNHLRYIKPVPRFNPESSYAVYDVSDNNSGSYLSGSIATVVDNLNTIAMSGSNWIESNSNVLEHQAVLGVRDTNELANGQEDSDSILVNADDDGSWVSYSVEASSEKMSSSRAVLGARDVKNMDEFNGKSIEQDNPGSIVVTNEEDGAWVGYSVENANSHTSSSNSQSVLGVKDSRQSKKKDTYKDHHFRDPQNSYPPAYLYE